MLTLSVGSLWTDPPLAYKEICLPSLLTMTWKVQLNFICTNVDMPSETPHRIGFESLKRVKLEIPLASSVALWSKVLWHSLP